MDTKVFLNTNISGITGTRETKGNKFGIELELEGRNVGLQDVAVRGWNRVKDGSLRGEAIEYTTAGAVSVDDVKKSVDNLFKKFKENDVKFKDSIRTSTHVHLNFSDKPLKQAVNFFALFTLIEEILQHYSGEDRKGNLFCISSREAEGIVGILVNAVGRGDLSAFAGDRFKYAACNLSTLYKFGTIEVRTMRGATSAEQVNNWTDILNDMYEYACGAMVSPADLVKDLSHLGAEAFMKKIFSEKSYRELMRHFPAVQNLHYSLMEGARLIQVFAYEFEEAFTAKVDIEKIAAKVVKKGRLPKRFERGGRRMMYAVYKPDGRPWNCSGADGGDYWEDGERVMDDRNIMWSQVRQRFIYRWPNGEVQGLNWAKHHEIEDEGAPIPRQLPERGARHPFPPLAIHEEFPGPPFEDEEDDDVDVEFEPEFDEDEEGDDY